MTDREKLVELLQKPIEIMPGKISSPTLKVTLPYAEELADHLIAHGVTILTEPKCNKINIKLPKEIVVQSYGDKWIPVTERLPEDDLQAVAQKHLQKGTQNENGS